MGKFGWGEVDKPQGGGDSKFLTIADGETATIRILDAEPFTVRLHQVQQMVGDKDVFRSIQATLKPDDDFIDANTNRFPAIPRHAMRCVEYDEDGDPVAVRVLMGGVQIFRTLKSLYAKHGDITSFDIEVSREGMRRDTSWMVSASPRSNDIDLEEWQEQIEADEWDFVALFPPVSGDDQEKILIEAGIDITYDPVVLLMEEMTLEDAKNVKLTFGRYGPEKYPPQGLTVGKAWEVDQGWIMWAAANVTSNDEVAAACRVMVDGTSALEGDGESKKKISSGEKKVVPPSEFEDDEDEEGDEGMSRDLWTGKGTPENYLARWFGKGGNKKKLALAIAIVESEGSTWPPEPEENDEEETDTEDDVRDMILEIFAEDDRFEDPTEIVKVVAKFGEGEKKVRKLNVAQLKKLYRYLSA